MTTAHGDKASGGDLRRGAIDRRTMLKAAAATGTIAAAWTAPHIESLGFAPAGAATPCTILSPSTQDKNANSSVPANVYCSTTGTFPCCTSGITNFGNQGNTFDEWTFANPHPGCSEIVVRLVPLDCEAPPPNSAYDPSLARMAVVIASTTGTCECTVLWAELLHSSGREFIRALNNGPSSCLEGGVDASIACNDPDLLEAGNSARLAVRIQCVTGNPGCV